MEGLTHYLLERNAGDLFRDGIDVLITYYLIYRASLVLRGTRAMQAGVGLTLLLLLYVASKYLELTTVFAILGTVLPSAILIIVVVFQDDIRRGLMRIGSGAWVGSGRFQEVRVIDEVIDAATELSRHRTGAIMAFEQDANLDEFVGSHKGIELDASVSSQLLVSLFIPEAMNKLHDGAVIIRNLRIAKAGVFFPFTQSRPVNESFGSRHRAALGITEETDAVLVVVSEETGAISFCFNGNIVSNLDGPRLRAALDGVFSPKAGKKRPRTGRFWSILPESLVSKARISTLPDAPKAKAKPPATPVRLHAAAPPEVAADERPSQATPLRKSVAKPPDSVPPGTVPPSSSNPAPEEA